MSNVPSVRVIQFKEKLAEALAHSPLIGRMNNVTRVRTTGKRSIPVSIFRDRSTHLYQHLSGLLSLKMNRGEHRMVRNCRSTHLAAFEHDL
nr:hypothetical protein CFP56_25910 [Quercus suber]